VEHFARFCVVKQLEHLGCMREDLTRQEPKAELSRALTSNRAVRTGFRIVR
jgi:hypothetical protein